MKNFTKLLPISLLLITFNILVAQKTTIDSLNNLLKKKSNNTEEQLKLRQKLCEEYIHSDLNKAMQETGKLILLSKTYKADNYEAKALKIKGNIFYFRGNNDSALLYFNLSLDICKKKNLDEDYFNTLSNIASIFSETKKLDSAIYLYNKVLRYFESCNNQVKTAKLLANIGALYCDAINLEKATEYTLKALEIQKKCGDRDGAIVSLLDLSIYAIDKKNYKEGIKYSEQAIALSKNYNQLNHAHGLIGAGICYYKLENSALAISYINKAIGIFKQNNSKRGLSEGYRTMAECLMSAKQYKKAKKYCLLSLDLTDTTYRIDLRICYNILKKISVKLNEHEEALYYSDKQIQLLKEELNENWSEKIADADAKYQSEKKAKEILKLQNEKQISALIIKRRNILIYGLFLTITLLIGITLLFFRHVRNKRIIVEQDLQLQKHKILELENEKMLLATQSVLKGEENERKRLAQDLHDGLGGLLSGTKIALNNMKNSIVLTHESVKDFNHALGMLETSITELRRVAHNMMPEALLNLGLKDALNDFCAELDKIDPTHILFQSFGQFERIDSNLEINAYRIILELVNNALKHSEAKELVVQMIQEPDRLCFIVQDDGIGFDSKKMFAKGGLGLASVKSRVDLFNGRMEINSNSLKGTEITVEFAI